MAVGFKLTLECVSPGRRATLWSTLPSLWRCWVPLWPSGYRRPGPPVAVDARDQLRGDGHLQSHQEQPCGEYCWKFPLRQSAVGHYGVQPHRKTVDWGRVERFGSLGDLSRSLVRRICEATLEHGKRASERVGRAQIGCITSPLKRLEPNTRPRRLSGSGHFADMAGEGAKVREEPLPDSCIAAIIPAVRRADRWAYDGWAATETQRRLSKLRRLIGRLRGWRPQRPPAQPPLVSAAICSSRSPSTDACNARRS